MNALARTAMNVPAMTRSFAAAAKNQKYYILMCRSQRVRSRLDDYVEGILEKRAPFRAGHLGLAKVCVLSALRYG